MSKNTLNHSEAIDRIIKLNKKDLTISKAKKEIFSILSITNEWEHNKVLDWIINVYKKAKWFSEKQRLQIISPLIASYIKREAWESGWIPRLVQEWKTNNEKDIWWKSWVISLLREKDSTWKYKVYKYQVKNWWYPKHIINEYVKQKKWNSEWVKITDSKWKEYPKDKKFSAWDIVYIKSPIRSIDKIDENTKEKIKIQEDYIDKQNNSFKKVLKNFNKEHPMWKDIELSFGIPVYHYEDIEKTLTSITTSQTMDPKHYEVIFLLNRPSNEVEFDKTVKEKILKFKLKHPEYNIHIFEHTFNFKKDDKGKRIVNYWKIYKTLADSIVYRNIQRKNIKWMDAKKIRNLIIKTWAADSTDKNPKYIENQLKKYGVDYSGKELVSMRWESRLPAEICKAYPLVEILEFFQRNFDNEYAGWAINRNVWIWSYKSRIYCDAKWFRWEWQNQWEDVALVKDVKRSIKNRSSDTTMYYDSEFIWAVDESCDRWIWAMVENNQPYCDRYIDTKGNIGSKEKNWNKYAIEHKWEEKFKVLELTSQNLEKNLSGFYKQRIDNIFRWKTYSAKYRGKKNSKWEHIPWTWYLDNEWKNATPQERAKRIAKNVINPIMENVLSKNDFMGLGKSDYSFWPITLEKYYDGKGKVEKFRVKSAQIKFNESSISKIKKIQNQKIKDWYYNYRKK